MKADSRDSQVSHHKELRARCLFVILKFTICLLFLRPSWEDPLAASLRPPRPFASHADALVVVRVLLLVGVLVAAVGDSNFNPAMFHSASVLLRGFASNPIEIEENTAGHLAAAKCWPQDGFSPRL